MFPGFGNKVVGHGGLGLGVQDTWLPSQACLSVSEMKISCNQQAFGTMFLDRTGESKQAQRAAVSHLERRCARTGPVRDDTPRVSPFCRHGIQAKEWLLTYFDQVILG